MATRIEEILGKDINSLKELREEIKRLQDSIANVDPETQEFTDTTKKLIAAQEQLTSVTRASKDANVAAEDSIVGMEKQYKSLYNTYKMLTEEQRNSDFGKTMATQLNDLSTKLNETKKGVGNFKDNIGRYTDSIIGAFKQMGVSIGGLSAPLKLATGGVTAFNTALKANPLMLIISAVQLAIGIFKKMKEAIAGNEELQMRWNEAMSAFQPIADAVSKGVQRLAEDFVKLIEGISKAVRWIREAGAAVTDFLGITKGAKKAVQEQNKLYQDIAKSQNQLIKNKREYQVLNAQDKAEVERLREEASETSNVEEKKRLLTEAKEKQAVIDQRNIEIAQEELRILQEQSKLTANSAADNDKLAAAVAKVADAEATAAANMRTFNKQLGLNKEESTGAKTSLKNYYEEAKKLYEETIENSKTEIQKLTEKYQKEKALLEKYHFDTTLLTKQYNKDMEKASKENAEKILENLKSLNTWKATAMYEYLTALFKDDKKVSKEMLKLQIELAEGYKSNFHFIFDNTELFKDTADQFKEQFEEAISDGFDLKFPPDDFVLDSERNLEEILQYVDNYFNNIITKAKKQRQEIEDAFIDERITKKIRADLEAAMRDELEVMGKGVGSNEFQAIYQRNLWESLNVEKEALAEELANFQGTQEKKLELLQQYYDVVAQMREREWELELLQQERTDQLWNDAVDAYDRVAASIQSVIGSISSLIEAQVQDGKITKKEADKKKKTLIALQKVALAVNIAQIAASTAAGIMEAWKGYATETASNAVTAAAAGLGAPAVLAALNAKSLASAILKTTGLAATGAANIAAAAAGTISKVRGIKGDESGGGETPVTATVAPIDSTPYTYTRQVQTAEEEDAIYNKEYWVSVTDINNVQNKVRVTEEESSF